MRLRAPSVLCALAASTLAACGSSAAYGCTNQTCRATFQGTGEQDLSNALGPGGTVEFVDVEDETVTARVAGKEAMLAKGRRQRVGRFDVTLTEVDGEDITLRIVGR